MKKLDLSAWPILMVSGQAGEQSDEGAWLRELIGHIEMEQHGSVICSGTLKDAYEIIYSTEDLGTIVFDLNMLGHISGLNKNPYIESMNVKTNIRYQNDFINFIRKRNKFIPILLLTDRHSIENIPAEALSNIQDIIWKLTDTASFLSGRITRYVKDYSAKVLPRFFNELVNYVYEYKYAWHTPGHMGGEGFLKSPSGTALHKFFGENMLRADLSISVPELGSLLDHSGLTGEAEQYSARVFGADRTYYVLNGTSTANQIIWRSQIPHPWKDAMQSTGVLVDRNCHKSLNYAMVITGAAPDYMRPMRNGLGMIGPVDFSKITRGEYKMSALTNSTYDGICYEMGYVGKQLGKINIMHFDEAWYAYAKFHPLYSGHYAMDMPVHDRLVFASQSTHKLLTAFSQASMIHVKFPDEMKESDEKREFFHDRFNESYMMHGSTSPQYNMIASLEIASKMMADNGQEAFTDIIEEAVELRKKIAQTKAACGNDDWFFGIWQPDCIASTPTDELVAGQEYWKIKPGDPWHGFKEIKDTYVMLDPIKLTFTCPGRTVNGEYEKTGIPAAIVTNFLIDRGIVCEKTDYYSWLLLNSLGTTKGKQGTLLAELFQFRKLYDDGALLSDIFPGLVNAYPQKYSGKTLKEHCTDMHRRISDYKLLERMKTAADNIPPQKLLPAEAYMNVVREKIEMVKLDDIKDKKRIAAVMIVPYPPGIPLIMGGEEISGDTLEYLHARQEFENEFPGYESDIHGIERTVPDENGKKYFRTQVIL